MLEAAVLEKFPAAVRCARPGRDRGRIGSTSDNRRDFRGMKGRPGRRSARARPGHHDPVTDLLADTLSVLALGIPNTSWHSDNGLPKGTALTPHTDSSRYGPSVVASQKARAW